MIKHNIIFLSFILLCTSCVMDDSYIKVTYQDKSKPARSISVASVQLVNNQFVIDGEGLDQVISIETSDGVSTNTLTIDSANANRLIVNTMNNVLISAGKVLNFVLSTAEASSSFSINFSLCDSVLNTKGFDCTLTPNDKDVLSYDSTADKWIPRAITDNWTLSSGNVYRLTGNVGIGLNNPAVPLDIYQSNATTTTLVKTKGVLSNLTDHIYGNQTSITANPTAASTKSLFGVSGQLTYNSSYDTTGSAIAVEGYTTVNGAGKAANIQGGNFFVYTSAYSMNNVYGSKSLISTTNGSASKMYGSYSGVSPWGFSGANIYGSYSEVVASGTTALTNSYGGYFKVYNMATGPTQTNAYGVYSEIGPAAGTITNGYGVYVGSIQGSTLKYSIYTSDSAAPVYVAGRVGLGVSAPTVKLDVNGDIKTNGCLYYDSTNLGTCASDERIKKDIHPFNLGLKALLGIDPVHFRYKKLAGFNEDKVQLGVIAQRIEKSAPELVGKKEVRLNPDDTEMTEIKSVDYGAFTYVIINAVKEFYRDWLEDKKSTKNELNLLKEDNAALKMKLAQMEKENAEVKARLLKMEAFLKK